MGCGSYDPNGQSLTCLGRGEVEMFVGGDGGGGATVSGRKRKQDSQRKNSNITGWHTDFQEVCVYVCIVYLHVVLFKFTTMNTIFHVLLI